MRWRIREIREQKGLTIETVAAAAGISKSYLSRLERGLEEGGRPINSYRLAALARVLECEISDLVPQSAIEARGMRLISLIDDVSDEDLQWLEDTAERLAKNPQSNS